MNTIMILLALAFGASFGHSNDAERLKSFLKKLENLQERQKDNPNKWPMPVYEPSAATRMPQMELSVVDEETGLEYSNAGNKIFDRLLEFELDLGSGTISDLKTGEKFAYKELINKQ